MDFFIRNNIKIEPISLSDVDTVAELFVQAFK
jgi:hypothetical protein